MKRIRGIITIIATSAILTAGTLLAAGTEVMSQNENQRDECLLMALNCAGEVDSINQKIERLHNEIAKGTDVYTLDELNTLRNKLNEAVNMVDKMLES